MIARVGKDGNVSSRDLQDLRQISHWGGGTEILKDETSSLLWAAVANQFFASAIVVDNEQKNRVFLSKARPTLETELTKGIVKSIAEDGSSFVLKPEPGGAKRRFMSPRRRACTFARWARTLPSPFCTIPARTTRRHGEYPEIATDFFPEDSLPALWVDDITVRVSTEPVELKGDEEVVHKYLLYNGPGEGQPAVRPARPGRRSLWKTAAWIRSWSIAITTICTSTR